MFQRKRSVGVEQLLAGWQLPAGWQLLAKEEQLRVRWAASAPVTPRRSWARFVLTAGRQALTVRAKVKEQ